MNEHGVSFTRRNFLTSIIALPDSIAFTQRPAEDRLERFRRVSTEAETKGLADPFKGITADGHVTPGLFAIRSTGVSTEAVRRKASVFLAGLIEFDHQSPANLRGPEGSPRVPNREHIHVVVRTPNRNDYGKDLLRQHYQQHKHSVEATR